METIQFGILYDVQFSNQWNQCVGLRSSALSHPHNLPMRCVNLLQRQRVGLQPFISQTRYLSTIGSEPRFPQQPKQGDQHTQNPQHSQYEPNQQHQHQQHQQHQQHERQTHFGYQSVPENEKVNMVKDVFRRVASKYDIMNDVMSGGVHRLWKWEFVSQLNLVGGMKILDVAGGTGDIAFSCIEALKQKKFGDSPSEIVLCDINPSMLQVGRDRALERGYIGASSPSVVKLDFVEGDAEKLPFPSDHFDLYTIAFGLRNVTRTLEALKEAHRVLKPGGRFMCLEFSQVENELLRGVYDMYSFNAIPLFGELIAGDRKSYQYLVESIRQFPNQQKLLQLMNEAGFKGTSFCNLTGGIAAIHSGFKI